MLSTLFLASVPLTASAQSNVIAFDYYHVAVGNQTIYRAYGVPGASFEQVDRKNFNGNLTAAGYSLKFLNGGLNSSGLQGVSVLFLGKINVLSLNFTKTEVQAIVSWFQTGNKLLMVSGDSDFTTNDTENLAWHAAVPNAILKAIGSQLRLEVGEITDAPGVGASGAGFRVYANAAQGGVNTAPWASNITMNTQRVRFHGTTNVIGWENGAYVAFSSIPTSTTVTWLYRTSPQGSTGLYGAAKPYVTVAQAPGQYVLAAAEKIAEGSTYSKVIVAGAGFYGNYIIGAPGEFSFAVTFQGTTFALNAVKWGITPESVPSQGFLGLSTTALIGVGAVIVIIIAGLAFVLIRRKPAAKP